MDKELKRKLNTLYTDILNGFSIRTTEQFGQFYIKHFNPFDAGEMDFEREQYFQKAISKGLPTEKENLEAAIKEGFWDKDAENSMYDLEKTIVNMRATKNKLQLRSQKINFQKKIDKKERALEELLIDRHEVVGYTAETFANKKANEYYIYKALKKDSNLKDEFFSEEEYDEMHDSDLQELISLYTLFTSEFSHKNLKRIAFSHSFLNLYHLCSDRVTELFGVPVVKMTFFQAEVFGTAKYFKSTLNNAKHRPTEEMYQDPDLMLDWMESNSGTKADIEGKMEEKAGVSYVGATKEDLKDLGVDGDSTISFSKEAAKKGGALDMKDIMKMHGYKV
tara:strand:- start:2328 stop:3332 length:1005 start_codon:yes stop_codon:yes gene_type:complete